MRISQETSIRVEVEKITAHGPSGKLLRLNAKGSILFATITRKACQQLAIQTGNIVYAQVKTVALVD